MAMLTNPFETQLVQSLGVRIGPAQTSSSAETPAEALAEAGPKCPFAGMVATTDTPAQATDTASVRLDVEC